MMSGQADSSWVTTVELYSEAEAFGASSFVLSNVKGCRKFVDTKKGTLSCFLFS